MTLAEVYEFLSSWQDVGSAQELVRSYFLDDERDDAEVRLYRERRGRTKKLRDEVVPVLAYARVTCFAGKVRFALNDSFPDAWLWQSETEVPTGMEVTIANARAQVVAAQILNKEGLGPGFMAIADNLSNVEVARLKDRSRNMYSGSGAVTHITRSIEACLKKKNNQKHQGEAPCDLLIEAPLNSVSRDRWNEVADHLQGLAHEMPFRQVHVISDRDGREFCMRLK